MIFTGSEIEVETEENKNGIGTEKEGRRSDKKKNKRK